MLHCSLSVILRPNSSSAERLLIKPQNKTILIDAPVRMSSTTHQDSRYVMVITALHINVSQKTGIHNDILFRKKNKKNRNPCMFFKKPDKITRESVSKKLKISDHRPGRLVLTAEVPKLTSALHLRNEALFKSKTYRRVCAAARTVAFFCD